MIDFISLGNNCEVGKICNYLNGNYTDKDDVHFFYRGLLSRQGEDIDIVKFSALFLKQCLDGDFSWIEQEGTIQDGKPGWCAIRPLVGHSCKFIRHYEGNISQYDKFWGHRHSSIEFNSIEDYRLHMKEICQFQQNPAKNYMIQLGFNDVQRIDNIPMLMEQLKRINPKCRLYVLNMNKGFSKYNSDQVRFIPLTTHIGRIAKPFRTPDCDIDVLNKVFRHDFRNDEIWRSCARISNSVNNKSLIKTK